MSNINKFVSAGRIKLFAGVLQDSITPLVIDDMGLDASSTNLRVGLELQVKSEVPVPSEIAVSIVDENTILGRTMNDGSIVNPAYNPITASVDSLSENSGRIKTEITVPLVNGVPRLSVVVNSNDPTITDTLTVTYRVIALVAS